MVFVEKHNDVLVLEGFLHRKWVSRRVRLFPWEKDPPRELPGTGPFVFLHHKWVFAQNLHTSPGTHLGL